MNELINPAESIRQKLKNLSIQKKRPFDEILRYYAMERFLYRLSLSEYKNRFFLKGGLLFRVWDQESHRPTMDIDFLAQVSNHFDRLEKIIQQISNTENVRDAISFPTENLTLKKMQMSGQYPGVRARFHAKLFRTKIPMIVDIGFNDDIIPHPQDIHYPTLLPMEKPVLKGYSPETVVAEKLETIIRFGLLNTRMKDFYDIWQIFQLEKIARDQKDVLVQAIRQVFQKRRTPLKHSHFFSSDFFKRKEVYQKWEAFLQAMDLTELPFEKILADIQSYLEPLFSNPML